MPKSVSPEQFQDAVPGYVRKAYALTDALLEKALSPEPGQDSQVMASPWGLSKHITDREEIRDRWEDREVRDLHTFNLDFGLEHLRLGVQVTEDCRSVWLYKRPETNIPPDADTNWIYGRRRNNYLSRFSHELIFVQGEEPQLSVILAQSTEDGRATNSELHSTHIEANDYLQADCPPLSRTELPILEQYGAHALLAHQVERMLRTLGAIANSQPPAARP